MRDADWFWLGLAVAGAGFEAWALKSGRDELTASRSVRRALHCHTPVGRFATTALIGAGSSWLAHHLLTIDYLEETP